MLWFLVCVLCTVLGGWSQSLLG